MEKLQFSVTLSGQIAAPYCCLSVSRYENWESDHHICFTHHFSSPYLLQVLIRVASCTWALPIKSAVCLAGRLGFCSAASLCFRACMSLIFTLQLEP